MSSQNRFGYEWDKYSFLTENYEHQFLNWTHPLSRESWQEKRVLDAGCGMGRNSYWPMKWGAESIVAFDYDERSVARSKSTLSKFSNTEVLFKSIYEITWKNEFDVAFSIGVIHHLKYPQKALGLLVDALKPGGELLVWVYSYEGNEWIVRVVDPVRKMLTSKLPVPVVHFLSYFCSVPLYLFVKIFQGPSNYLKQLSKFNFWHIHSIVFDQLIPDIANYWKKKEVQDLLSGLPVSNVTVCETPEGTGWILRAKKTDTSSH